MSATATAARVCDGEGSAVVSAGFGALLRGHREARRWSQERLAGEAEVDHSLVSRFESGRRGPTRDMVERLVAGLALPGDDADALRIAAGYVPERRGSMVADEPAVVLVYMLLHDETIAEPVKAAVREQLRALVLLGTNTTRVLPRAALAGVCGDPVVAAGYASQARDWACLAGGR